MPELLLILAIVVVLFGASKLPQLGQGLGEGLRSFKKAFRDMKDDEPDALPEKPQAGQPSSSTKSTQAVK
jgi:sec-independent protein translocase protein TatA